MVIVPCLPTRWARQASHELLFPALACGLRRSMTAAPGIARCTSLAPCSCSWLPFFLLACGPHRIRDQYPRGNHSTRAGADLLARARLRAWFVILGAAIALLEAADVILNHLTTAGMRSPTAILMVTSAALRTIGHLVVERRRPAMIDNPASPGMFPVNHAFLFTAARIQSIGSPRACERELRSVRRSRSAFWLPAPSRRSISKSGVKRIWISFSLQAHEERYVKLTIRFDRLHIMDFCHRNVSRADPPDEFGRGVGRARLTRRSCVAAMRGACTLPVSSNWSAFSDGGAEEDSARAVRFLLELAQGGRAQMALPLPNRAAFQPDILLSWKFASRSASSTTRKNACGTTSIFRGARAQDRMTEVSAYGCANRRLACLWTTFPFTSAPLNHLQRLFGR